MVGRQSWNRTATRAKTWGVLPVTRLVTPARVASAHSGTHSYVYVVVDDATVTGNVQFPIADLTAAAGLSIPQEESAALAAIAANRAALEQYARSHLRFSGDPTVEFTGVRVLERKAGSYAILEYRVHPQPDFDPREFVITYDGIMHAKDHHESIIVVKSSSGFGPLRTVQEKRIDGNPDQIEHRIAVPASTAWADVVGAGRYLSGEGKELVRRARKRLRR